MSILMEFYQNKEYFNTLENFALINKVENKLIVLDFFVILLGGSWQPFRLGIPERPWRRQHPPLCCNTPALSSV